MNKEFFKSLFKGDKKAHKVTDVKHIIVPKIDELGIIKMLDMVRTDPLVKQYLPDEYYKKLTPDRSFFFNTINTLYDGFIPELISGAQRQRVEETKKGESEQVIEATDEWLNNLSAIPFYSKVSRILSYLNVLL